MKKLPDKQSHPNEIDSDNPTNESIDCSVKAQTTALPSNESTEFVNSIQISQAIERQNHEKDNQTDFVDSSIPAGETLPLPTADEINQALRHSNKTHLTPEETQAFLPAEDPQLTEPINAFDSLDNPDKLSTPQFNEQTETLPIFNQSSSKTDTNGYPDENRPYDQHEQIDCQNAGNIFDNPKGNNHYTQIQQHTAPSRTDSAAGGKTPNNTLFLRRFIPVALMVFSAFASIGIIAHAALNQSYGGPGYNMQQGPHGGMRDGNGYQNGNSDYSGNGSAQTQSVISLVENNTPSDNSSESDKGNSGKTSNPSSDNNRSGDGNFSQGGLPGDGSLQGPPDANTGYMDMSSGLTTLHVLALAFCAIIFACSLVYIIVTRFGARPFALDKNTKILSALGVAGIALVITGGLTAGTNTLISLSAAMSGGNRYGDAGSGYNYGYYDGYDDHYDGGYGYYDDYSDGYYDDNGEGYDYNNDNSKDNSKNHPQDRSKNGGQPNSGNGDSDLNTDPNISLYSDV